MTITALFLAVLLFAGNTPVQAETTETVETTIVKQGTCGSNLTWTLDSDGLLSISGTGAMNNYYATQQSNTSPWGSYNTEIKSIKFEEKITHIGNCAFALCMYTTGELKLPESLESIGESAFYQCYKMTGEMNIPEKVSYLGTEHFMDVKTFPTL